MLRYYIRLDDVHAKMDLVKWEKIVSILDDFGIKAIIGVIPDNKDSEINRLEKDIDFWKIVKKWNNNGHIIALHGLNHLKNTKEAGLVPKNKRSEFAGLDMKLQREKIFNGLKYFKSNDLNVNVFIPPFHSFDRTTIEVLLEHDINIIYDGISFYPYQKYEILFFPQQYNSFSKKNNGCWSICLHPSTMTSKEFREMEEFISKNRKNFHNDFFRVAESYKYEKLKLKDILFSKMYFLRRKLFFLKKRIFYGRD